MDKATMKLVLKAWKEGNDLLHRKFELMLDRDPTEADNDRDEQHSINERLVEVYGRISSAFKSAT